jgi:hypothetical protein
LKWPLLAPDLGAMEVSRSATHHLADMRRRSLALKLLRISATINGRFKVQPPPSHGFCAASSWSFIYKTSEADNP